MKTLVSFVLGILLFVCPFAVQAEQIADASVPDQKSDEAIRYLQGEDMYQGTLSWQGNKVSTKFNYDMKKEKR